MKTFENGKDYQLTNWIDCEATEFVGLSFGKIALHYNDELQVSIKAKPLIAIVRNCRGEWGEWHSFFLNGWHSRII